MMIGILFFQIMMFGIVGHGGEIDEFCYNYDTGYFELKRLIKENQPHYHFVFGNPRNILGKFRERQR